MAGIAGPQSGPQLGCMDPMAINYCAGCTVDDGSCDYATTNTATEGITISFSEAAKGWTSFKSFVQDGGLSLNNNYYTFRRGAGSGLMLWEHHSNQIRNNFYDDQYDSHVDVLFNEESATVKSFASMKYEGSQAKITKNLGDKDYYNNEGDTGWYVESGITDLQLAGEMEFKDKEGKWFSYMKGVPVKTVADLNSKEFSYQGIDIVTIQQFGCLDPRAENYDPYANLDCTKNPVTSGSGDTSCCCYNYGCTDDTIGLYPDVDGKDQDGRSCDYPCTKRVVNSEQEVPNGFLAYDYDPNADCDDDSCFYPRWWCDNGRCTLDLNPTTSANRPYEDYQECIEIGCETPSVIPGCMDNGSMGQAWWDGNYASLTSISVYPANPYISNYNPLATVDDGSCCYTPGCTDPNACNYDSLACHDDGSCVYLTQGCTDILASNYDPTHTGCVCNDITDTSCCNYDVYGCTDPTANNYNYDCNNNFVGVATIDDECCDYSSAGCTDVAACNYDPNATVDDGSCVFPPPQSLANASFGEGSPNLILSNGSGAHNFPFSSYGIAAYPVNHADVIATGATPDPMYGAHCTANIFSGLAGPGGTTANTYDSTSTLGHWSETYYFERGNGVVGSSDPPLISGQTYCITWDEIVLALKTNLQCSDCLQGGWWVKIDAGTGAPNWTEINNATSIYDPVNLGTLSTANALYHNSVGSTNDVNNQNDENTAGASNGSHSEWNKKCATFVAGATGRVRIHVIAITDFDSCTSCNYDSTSSRHGTYVGISNVIISTGCSALGYQGDCSC